GAASISGPASISRFNRLAASFIASAAAAASVTLAAAPSAETASTARPTVSSADRLERCGASWGQSASSTGRSSSDSSAAVSCTNRLALSNGSYVGSFSCPFLGDEPSSWTKCCGYENEQFCCDPAYDDSWALASQGLSFVAIFFIVGGCLTGLAIVGVLIFLCVRKGLLNTRRPGVMTAPTAATAVVTSPPVSVAPVQAISKWVPMAPGPGQPPVVGSNPPPYPTSNAGQPPVVGSNPPPYPTSNAGQPPVVGSNPPSYPASNAGQPIGMENQGFEPPPYPLYPPSYQNPYANANAPDYG
uniref:WW domain-binding protein 11 n=1 Tax=Macrostomum lignano TaxID=282301 RepID=A0A1I8HRM7_9PLAT